MIHAIKQLFTKHKRFLYMGFFAVIFSLILIDPTFAELDAGVKADLEKAKDNIATGMSWVSGLSSVFLSLLTYLSAMFLSPEWMSGSLFGIKAVIENIWVFVSNIVYFIFAFILIGIAFMNIIGKGENNFALNQALPKFVVGILIVPASLFFVKFVVSVAGILTIGVLNLPFDTFEQYVSANKINDVKVPTQCEINLTTLSRDEEKAGDGAQSDKFFDCGEAETSLKEVLAQDNSLGSIYGVVSTYTYGILGTINMDEINKEIDAIETFLDLIVKIVFDLVFMLIYTILIIALGLVLMTRGIWLWVYTMFSPLFGLMYFFGKTSGGGGFFDKFNLKEFFALAMVPVYSMAALSFGMLFLFVVENGLTNPQEDAGSAHNMIRLSSQGESEVLEIGEGEGMISLTINGTTGTTTSLVKGAGDITEKGLGLIGSLILKIFGVVVLWGAMMAAMKSSKVTESIIQPLADFGQKVGDIASKSPQYLPIFGGQSMASMSNVANTAQGVFNTTALNQAKDLTSKVPWFSQGEFTDTIRSIATEIQSSNDPAEASRYLNKVIRAADGNATRIVDGMNEAILAMQKNSNYSNISAVKNFKPGTKIDDFKEVIKEINGNTKFGEKYVAGKQNPVIGDILKYSKEGGDKTDPNAANGNSSTGGTGNKTINIQVNAKQVKQFLETDTSGGYRGIQSGKIEDLVTNLNLKDSELKNITQSDFESKLKEKISNSLGSSNIEDSVLDKITKDIGDHLNSKNKFS